MIFKETSLQGAYEIELEIHADERGFFARSYCAREFEEHGLNPCVVQCNVSYNRSRGTLRGMHYQEAPAGEAKLIRCARGALLRIDFDSADGSLRISGARRGAGRRGSGAASSFITGRSHHR